MTRAGLIPKELKDVDPPTCPTVKHTVNPGAEKGSKTDVNSDLPHPQAQSSVLTSLLVQPLALYLHIENSQPQSATQVQLYLSITSLILHVYI